MFIDITKDKCPITFVKTKIAIEKLQLANSKILPIVKFTISREPGDSWA